jgi:hypothetical protein
MVEEPLFRQDGDPLQGAWLAKQVTGTREDSEMMGGGHGHQGLFVESENLKVCPPHNEQTGTTHLGNAPRCQIGAPTAAHERPYVSGACCRREEGRGSTGARAKQPDRNRTRGSDLCLEQPVDSPREASREEGDIKTPVMGLPILCFFLGYQQVEQERGQSNSLQALGDTTIARTASTAAAAMGKDNDTLGRLWPAQISLKDDAIGREIDLFRGVHHPC